MGEQRPEPKGQMRWAPERERAVAVPEMIGRCKMKRVMLSITSGIALSAVVAFLLQKHKGPRLSSPEQSSVSSASHRTAPSAADRAAEDDRLAGRDPALAADVVRRLLIYGIPPIWIAAGFADWLCHRAAKIETNAGAKESLLHLLMLAELGVPTLACLFLEITPQVIALSLASFLVHQATALWDLEYATEHREIAPIEQQVHSFLELNPLMAIAFIAALRWPEVVSSMGADGRGADFGFKLRKRPLPARYVVSVLSAVGLFNGLPYLEELWRTSARFGATERPHV
jgi:hypothetical protein